MIPFCLLPAAAPLSMKESFYVDSSVIIGSRICEEIACEKIAAFAELGLEGQYADFVDTVNYRRLCAIEIPLSDCQKNDFDYKNKEESKDVRRGATLLPQSADIAFQARRQGGFYYIGAGKEHSAFGHNNTLSQGEVPL